MTRLDGAFDRSQTTELSSVFESLANRPSTTVAFGTEATHLASTTAETIVFGPGDMTVAREAGEFVPIEELKYCVNYLIAAIERLCCATAA